MRSSNDAVNDECEALNSIYGADTITVTSSSADATVILRIPSLSFSFVLSYPPDYPDGPPHVHGTHSTGSSGRGEGEVALKVLREVLGKTYKPGQVCLFDLIEEAVPLLRAHDHVPTEDNTKAATDRSVPSTTDPSSDLPLTIDPAASLPPPPWIVSEALTVNKSIFVARACPVSTVSEVTDAVSHLLATNKKVASATHNIKSWRIKNQDSGSTAVQDYDDDGESAAGARLLRLLQLMDVSNILVVVTRWYGGVKLGPDRFRIINNVAREVVLKGGFVKDEEKGKSKTKGK